MCRVPGKAYCKSLVCLVRAGDEAGASRLLLQERVCCRDILEESYPDTDQGGTPLFWAAVHGFSLIVDLVLQRGVNVDSTNVCDATPLHAAIDNGHNQIAR